MSFQKRLKEERKKLKLTQKELAQILMCSETSIVAYEKGTTNPQSEVLERLAPLGFDVQYIITGICSDMALSPDDKELLGLYRNANDTIKTAVKAVLKTGLTSGHTVSVNGNLNRVKIN